MQIFEMLLRVTQRLPLISRKISIWKILRTKFLK